MEVDLAPTAELVRYLRLLKDALVVIRNHGLAQGRDEALLCGYVADALHNLPDLLVRYGEFDQDRFWRDVEGLRSQVPAQLRDNWDALFGGGRS